MNRIIVMFKDEDKELNMSVYDFIDEQYRYSNPFMVCHVTEEEYQIMLNQIKQGCLYERIARITDYGYDKFRYLLAYDSLNNNISVADYDNLEKRGNYVIDSEGIHFNERGYQFPKDFGVNRFFSRELKIYTTESYEQVIEHYEKTKGQVKITLSADEIKRYEKAYNSLAESLDHNDYTEKDLREFRVLFAKIVSRCD